MVVAEVAVEEAARLAVPALAPRVDPPLPLQDPKVDPLPLAPLAHTAVVDTMAAAQQLLSGPELHPVV